MSGRRESLGGFLTKREALDWSTAIEAEIRAGKAGKWPAKTLSDALDRYEREITPGKASSANELKRFTALRRDFPALCSRLLTEITPDDLANWVRERLKTVKPATVKRESHSFSNVWTVAAREWRWCPVESPWTFTRVPNDGPPRDRRVSWQEVRRIVRRLGYVTGLPPTSMQAEVAYAFLLALMTAMRSGELLGLTPDAVDIQNRVVTLAHHKTLRYTGRARHVPITRQAARLFAVLLTRGAVFTVSDSSRDALFRKITAQLGIDGLRFHDSRAEALTLLARKVDVLTLQRISGHLDLNQLGSTYYRESAADIAKRL